MRKLIPFISIFCLTLLSGVQPTGVQYDVNNNSLEINFSDNIRTDNVLLGLISFSDGSNTMTVSGGEIMNPGEITDSIIIDLVYKTQIDERVNTTDGNSDTFQYWGMSNAMAGEIEDMDLENLQLNISEGAFVGEDYAQNSAVSSMDITILNQSGSSPVVIGANYIAGDNLLEIYFDRIVKFDQIAEDRAPGNNMLDGNPSEDTNGNGVLDTEQNINPFNITIQNGSASATLEGLKSVIQTADSDTMSIVITNRDAKKIELDVLGEDFSNAQLILKDGAFVDTMYNQNQLQTSGLTIVPDDMPLVLTNATYDPEINEFRLYFENSRNVEIYNPFPVYSKINISDGENSLHLNGLRNNLISAIGTTMIFNELLYSDQQAIEQLMQDASNSGITINLDTYSVYDVNGNGNLSQTLDLSIIGGYDEPSISDAVYEASGNRIVLNWEPDKISYYELTLLEQDPQNLDISGISVTNNTSGETLVITNADLSRDFTKNKTYLRVSFADAEWFETAGEYGDALEINVDPYTFFSSGNTNNNGNFLISALPLEYTPDDTGPIIKNFRIDSETHQLITVFDENVETGNVQLNSVDLVINDITVHINDLVLLTENETATELRFQISESEFGKITSEIPSGQFLDMKLVLPTDAFQNIDNMVSLPCTDLNNNFMCDDTPESFDDYGSDGVPSDQEDGYPGFCSEIGGCSDPTLLTESECSAAVCSDPQFDNEDDCLEDGSCQPRFFGSTRDACESHVPPGTWLSDNDWETAGVWTDYETEAQCLAGGAVWTAVLDPQGDDYDSILNPSGTEGNGNYDTGEPFTDDYANGVWDEFEPVTFELAYGRELWNESHRAFAAAPQLMHLAEKYHSDQFTILVEESIWNGFCIETDSGVNPYDIYEDVHTPGECDALPHNSDHDPVWVQVKEDDVQLIADFFNEIKSDLESRYGDLQDINGDGKIDLVLYDIVDEYIRGSNDSNSSLYTHGYFTVYPVQDANPDEEITVNPGELLFLDAFPQIIATEDPDEEDFASMYNAIIHEYTKLLITQNESEEEIWLREGLAFFEQKRILDDVKFFGNGTDPKTPAANQLTYISFSKKSRTDQFNVYLFLNYLFEKYSGPTGWEIIDELGSPEYQGIESVNNALQTLGFGDVDMRDVFIDYATACFLDVGNELGAYNGRFNMNNIDLYGAPSGKNAASFTFDEAKPPPYSKTGIPPWSFDYYLIGGFSVSLLDNSLIFQSPQLDPDGDLVIDGYDGIEFKANKIILKNGFTENMNPLYEVVPFEFDPVNGKAVLPVSTNTINGENFSFKDSFGECEDGVSGTAEECCINNSGTWNGNSCTDGIQDWIWSGNMNLILVVAKVDDTQPPASYDYVVSNITTPPDFSDFYVLQNSGVHNFLDLYVVSQRPIYDAYGIEGPSIQIASQFDTTNVLLEQLSSPGDDQVIYYSPFTLGLWDHYTLTYNGMDQSGNSVETDIAEVNTEYSIDPMGRYAFSTGDDYGIKIYEPDEDVGFIQISNSSLQKTDDFQFNIDGLTPASNVYYFGPGSYTPSQPMKLWFRLVDDSNISNTKVYHLTENGWINLGGFVSDDIIYIYSDTMGYYLLVSGENHLADQGIMNIPQSFRVKQNYPNPFNPSTRLDFSLPDDGNVNINIYNITGQLVSTLVHDFYPAGEYTAVWDGSTKNGTIAPSGLYFARIETENNNKTIKMVMMK